MNEHIIDAKGKRLGRLASSVALLLQGKAFSTYHPAKLSGDRVAIKNYRHVTIGGNKTTQKIYYRHTGYMGHLKEKTFEQMFAKDPKQVIREAVRRMLPKNFLNQRRLSNITFIEDGT